MICSMAWIDPVDQWCFPLRMPLGCCGNRVAVPNNCIDTYIKCLWCECSNGLITAAICLGIPRTFVHRISTGGHELLKVTIFGTGLGAMNIQVANGSEYLSASRKPDAKKTLLKCRHCSYPWSLCWIKLKQIGNCKSKLFLLVYSLY